MNWLSSLVTWRLVLLNNSNSLPISMDDLSLSVFISLRKSRPRLLSIDTLISDIEGLFINGATLTEQALKTFTQAVGTNLEERFSKYNQARAPKLWLSNVGKPLRQLWFEIKGTELGLKPETLSPSSKFKFLFGDILEDFIILLALEAGHSVDSFQRKVEVDGVTGKIDCVIDGVLVDIKSASTFSFQKFKDGSIRTQDPFGYVAQLSGYSHAMGNMDGAFLVVDKTLGHLTLCRFSKEELAEYDVRERIKSARENLSRDEPPVVLCYDPQPEGKSGNFKLPVGCSYCSWKFECHKEANNGRGLRTFLYSTGPVYLTNVAQEPRVKEITNG